MLLSAITPIFVLVGHGFAQREVSIVMHSQDMTTTIPQSSATSINASSLWTNALSVQSEATVEIQVGDLFGSAIIDLIPTAGIGVIAVSQGTDDHSTITLATTLKPYLHLRRRPSIHRCTSVQQPLHLHGLP
jgi:hypothetical protein